MNRMQIIRLITYLLLIVGCSFMLLPVITMFSTALKSTSEVFTSNPSLIPREFHIKNFWKGLFDNTISFRPFNFLPSLKNSIVITLLNIIGNILSCSLVAYGFARFSNRWNRPLFIVMLSVMMMPPIVLSIPTFVLFVKYLGWYDTLYPLWVPSFFGFYSFFIFLLHEFFKGIPITLIEAARIDGSSEIGIFFKIVMPLSKPAIMVVGVFTFIWTWNDFFTPLLYIEDVNKYTLALSLQRFVRGSMGSAFGIQWNYLMAASIVVIIPIVILFFLAQRYFIEGISLTGMKQ